jgi:hypothetical protein
LYVQLIDIQQRENTAFLNLLNLHRIWSFLSVFSWKLAMTPLEAAKIVGHGDVQIAVIAVVSCYIWLSGSIPYVGNILCVCVCVFWGFSSFPRWFFCRTKMSPLLDLAHHGKPCPDQHWRHQT